MVNITTFNVPSEELKALPLRGIQLANQTTPNRETLEVTAGGFHGSVSS
jgi:hypothetical protein